MEGMGCRGRRNKQLLDDRNEKRGYCKLKEETSTCTLWRIRFGRRYEPVVRQTENSITHTHTSSTRMFLPVFFSDRNISRNSDVRRACLVSSPRRLTRLDRQKVRCQCCTDRQTDRHWPSRVELNLDKLVACVALDSWLGWLLAKWPLHNEAYYSMGKAAAA